MRVSGGGWGCSPHHCNNIVCRSWLLHRWKPVVLSLFSHPASRSLMSEVGKSHPEAPESHALRPLVVGFFLNPNPHHTWPSLAQHPVTSLDWDPVCAIHFIKKLRSSLDVEWVQSDLFVLKFGLFLILNGGSGVDCTQLLTVLETERHMGSEKPQKDWLLRMIIFPCLFLSLSNWIMLTSLLLLLLFCFYVCGFFFFAHLEILLNFLRYEPELFAAHWRLLGPRLQGLLFQRTCPLGLEKEILTFFLGFLTGKGKKPSREHLNLTYK